MSLSLFESLRGLRDAVAPDSTANPDGNQGIAPCFDTSEPDYDGFLISFHKDDPFALEIVAKAGGKPPRSREEYSKILLKMERERDVSLVSSLAEEVLAKSATVDKLVAKLPGMERTKTEQMKRIEELLNLNKSASDALEKAYAEAESRRDEVRLVLSNVTCEALGIEEIP